MASRTGTQLKSDLATVVADLITLAATPSGSSAALVADLTALVTNAKDSAEAGSVTETGTGRKPAGDVHVVARALQRDVRSVLAKGLPSSLTAGANPWRRLRKNIESSYLRSFRDVGTTD